MTARRYGYALLALTLLFALAPAYRGVEEIPLRLHHLLHGAILMGGAISALLIVRGPVQALAARIAWLLAAVLAPMVAMIAMWPSAYSPLEHLPAAHALEHVVLLALGFLTAYAGQQFAAGVGIAMSLSLWTMAFLAAWGYGISPPLQVSSVAAAPASGAAATKPDPVHGKALFAQNCSACHGARGRGGLGPSLIGEATRKNVRQAVAWIENPRPPMPKLYPSALDAADVRDVAAYVESLK